MAFEANPRSTTALTTYRDISTRLPGWLQEQEHVQKLFPAVYNHHFQEVQEQELSGFIGRRSSAASPSDIYIEGPTPDRTYLGLEPMSVSYTPQNDRLGQMFYQDLVDDLRFQGANTKNHSRLFEQEFRSYAPPVNPDMLLNYANYYWLKSGPSPVDIVHSTVAATQIIGQAHVTLPGGTGFEGSVSTVGPNGEILSIEIDLPGSGYIGTNAIVQDVNTTGSGSGAAIEAVLDSGTVASFVITSPGVGYVVGDPVRVETEFKFESGSVVIFRNDANSEFNSTPFIVENVGRSIQLIENNEYVGSDEPDYLVIERGSPESSPWSDGNKWFHRNTIRDIITQDLRTVQARRPIIQFDAGLKLFNFGTLAREFPVPVVRYHGSVSDIQGKTSFTVGLDSLTSGDYVLITNDLDSTLNNRVYRVNVVSGTLVLFVDRSGSNPDGSPELGECIRTTTGYWHYDGSDFIRSQQKTSRNQDPLFELTDSDGISLNDGVVYPNSSFSGGKLFWYAEDAAAEIDPYTDKRLKFDQYGDVSFNRINAQTFANGTVSIPHPYNFVRSGQIVSDFAVSSARSRQAIIQEFVLYDDAVAGFDRLFSLENPAPSSIQVFLNGQKLTESIDYDVNPPNEVELSLTLQLTDKDRLMVKSIQQNNSSGPVDGYYEIPANLQANPLNADFTEIKLNDLFSHLVTMIENQTGIQGSAYGSNNWNSTARDNTIGTELVQHTGPLLGLMSLSSADIELCAALRFVQREYVRFVQKFKLQVEKLANTGAFTDSSDVVSIVDQILDTLAVAKTSDSVFSNSLVTGVNKFVPPSAAYLGFVPTVTPEIFNDQATANSTLSVRMHDGSVMPAYDDFRDSAFMELQARIVNSYEAITPIQAEEILPGKFRSGSYSREEFISITRPMFELFALDQAIDYRTNYGFNVNDPFTWNYSSCVDFDGVSVPGSYRGIYQWLFDTVRPHTHPWEMFGFGQKPDWFDYEYGAAPYTGSNLKLWTDVQNGYIRGELRTDLNYARPGVLAFIPVGPSGELLDPYAAGIVTAQPSATYAATDFEYGDIGPGEYFYRQSSVFAFDRGLTMFLMRPAEVFGKLFDLGKLFLTPADMNLHTNSNFVRGFSMVISEFLKSKNISVTRIQELLTYSDVRLGYRTGSFVRSDDVRFISDSFGDVPEPDYEVFLNTSSSRSEPAYSAVVVYFDGSSYRVRSYDVLNPLRAMKVDSTGNKTSVTVGSVTVVSHQVFTNEELEYVPDHAFSTIQQTYDFIIGYGEYMEKLGFVFDQVDPDNAVLLNFRYVADQFLLFASNGPQANDAIVLNPAGDQLKFRTPELGYVGEITRLTNGAWTAIRDTGTPIVDTDITVNRQLDYTTFKTNDGTNFGVLRLTTFEVEHGVIFKNVTTFGDTIYQQLTNTRIKRLRVTGIQTSGWNGRLFAPGYIIKDNGLIPNFDKQASDPEKFYDPDSFGLLQTARKSARQLAGFTDRDYMERLLVDDRSTFLFMNKAIREKGTNNAIQKLFRSNYVANVNGDMDIVEYWGIKVGEYGGTAQTGTLEFLFKQSEIKGNPQAVRFTSSSEVTSDSKFDDVITIYGDNYSEDSRWIRRSGYPNMNVFRTEYSMPKMSAGYVQVGETDYTAGYVTELPGVVEQMQDAETVWLVRNAVQTFDVLKLTSLNDSGDTVRISYLEDHVDQPMHIFTTEPHNLTAGDIIKISADTLTTPNYEGVQTVFEVISPTEFTIEEPGTLSYYFWSSVTGSMKNPTVDQGEVLRLVDSDGTDDISFQLDAAETFTVLSAGTLADLGGSTLTVTDGAANVLLSAAFSKTVVQSNISNPRVSSGSELSVNGITASFPETRFVLSDTDFDIGTDTVTINAHGLLSGESVKFSGATLPTGLVQGTEYCLIVTGLNTFQLELSVGSGAIDLTALNTGTHIMEVQDRASVYAARINSVLNILEIEATVSANKIVLTEHTGSDISLLNITGNPKEELGLFDKSGWDLDSVIDHLNSIIPGIASDSNGQILLTFDVSSTVFPVTVAETGSSFLFPSSILPIVGTSRVIELLNSGNYQASLTSDGYLKIENTKGYQFVISDQTGTPVTKLGLDTLTEDKNDDTVGPIVYRLKSLRFANTADRGNGTQGWEQQLDRAFVDDVDSKWKVYEYQGANWVQVRVQNPRCRISDVQTAFAIDNATSETRQKLVLFDPAKSIYPGSAMSELSYILEIDPAHYSDHGDQWGVQQTGQLWFDTSSVRYIDYEQSDLMYRRRHWGKTIGGSEFNVYEWTRSPVSPEQYDSYVSQAAGSEFSPTGSVRNTTDYIQTQETDPSTGTLKNYWYFWVKNPELRPNKSSRKISAARVRALLESPHTAGVPWIAPCDSNGVNDSAFLIGNHVPYVTDDNTVIQINLAYHERENEVHKEFVLVGEGDSDSVPDSVWRKLEDSLLEVDGSGLSVPDPSLDPALLYGNSIRPRQSWFKDVPQARKVFSQIGSNILSSENVRDNETEFDKFFEFSDPEPSADFFVLDINARSGLELNPVLTDQKTVVVRSDSGNLNRWVHYLYHESTNSWEELSRSTFDARSFWEFIDFYQEGYDEFSTSVRYGTISDRDADSFEPGDIVLVLDNGEGRWVQTEYGVIGSTGYWTTTGIQSGTVEFNSRMYSDSGVNSTGYQVPLAGDQLGLTIANYLKSERVLVIRKFLEFFKAR